jgi:hypothetical protein
MALKMRLGDTLVFGVRDHREAALFYERVFGFKSAKTAEDYTGLETGSRPLYMVEQEGIRQPIFEIYANDVPKAVTFMEQHGCLLDERLSEDAGDPVLRDPHGFVWCVTKDPVKE